jgi:hypothetical protein
LDYLLQVNNLQRMDQVAASSDDVLVYFSTEFEIE